MMLYILVLCRVVLYCDVQRFFVLCFVLCCNVLPCAVLCCVVLCCVVLCWFPRTCVKGRGVCDCVQLCFDVLNFFQINR